MSNPDKTVVMEPVSMESAFTQLIGMVATVMTICQFFSGTFTARKVWQMGTPGDLSPVPFIAGVLGSSLWFLYGIQLQNATIMYTNVAGVVLNSFYVLVFYIYTQKKVFMSRQVMGLLIGITAVTVYIRSFSLTDAEIARNQLGLICTVVSLSVCASPLVALKQVIKTKSTESLPFPLIVSVFVVCLLWWVYGFLIGDIYMQITNSLGTLISIAQLSLFFIYSSTSAVHHEKSRHQLLKSVT